MSPGLVILLTTALAWADPLVTIDADGAVTGTIETPVPADVLRARLADPTWLPTVSQDGTRVSVVRPDGACLIVDSDSPAIVEVRYRTRQCPTPDGFVSTLVASDSFSAYTATWTLVPTAAGTRATYHIALASSLWVPEAIVRRTTRAGIAAMLANLEAWRP